MKEFAVTIDHQYERLLQKVLYTGDFRPDRTGVGTYSRFSEDLRYDLSQGFPLITTKKVHLKSIVGELIWFLNGNTNVKYLRENGIRIWDEWAHENGDLGPVYGAQWRDFGSRDASNCCYDDWLPGVDQIANVIESLKRDPFGRRHLVSAWNPVDIPEMNLPPCHFAFQFYVSKSKLSCKVFQRSADMFLGVPFNIASYALLTHMMAKEVGLEVGELVWTGTDVHVYADHRNQVREQIAREPREFPTLILADVPSIFDYKIEDVSVVNYDPHPAIKAKVAV